MKRKESSKSFPNARDPKSCHLGVNIEEEKVHGLFLLFFF
jgi:hypothetical protein